MQEKGCLKRFTFISLKAKKTVKITWALWHWWQFTNWGDGLSKNRKLAFACLHNINSSAIFPKKLSYGISHVRHCTVFKTREIISKWFCVIFEHNKTWRCFYLCFYLCGSLIIRQMEINTVLFNYLNLSQIIFKKQYSSSSYLLT